MEKVFSTEKRGDITVIRFVFDEISLVQREELKKKLEEIPVDENRKFIIDLSGVGFLSSLVIATVVFFAKKVKENNGELKLSGLSSEAYSVLQITQLDKVFDLHDTEDDAVQSFK